MDFPFRVSTTLIWYLIAPEVQCLVILISAGIDLAKNHFSLHAVDPDGKVILQKSVTRSKLPTTIANMPLVHIGAEMCGGAHYCARTPKKLGYDARTMDAGFACCGVSRPT